MASVFDDDDNSGVPLFSGTEEECQAYIMADDQAYLYYEDVLGTQFAWNPYKGAWEEL